MCVCGFGGFYRELRWGECESLYAVVVAAENGGGGDLEAINFSFLERIVTYPGNKPETVDGAAVPDGSI